MTFAERYGPWALILGASEGTGAEFARQVAAQGVPSILIARRTAPLDALAGEIRARHGVDCIAGSVDLSAPDATAQVVAAVGDRQVGLFVGNAGGDPNGDPFLDRDIATWTTLIQRNVVTMMACTHRFAGPMRERGRGGILLINSGACYGGASTLGAYSGSKAFLLTFAESLWAELGPAGLDVLTLVLGQTDTPEFRRFMADKGMSFPANTAAPNDVARTGLERLPHGPVHNIGQADDAAGMSNLSAADRRARVVGISAAIDRMYGRG